ncbi:MAG: helix-turn-helix domain-containing protein [Alphaproteobacteria bacterium]|nr:helix-turn-helix domain-containing protein [Alphaproteobacteria bacterium]
MAEGIAILDASLRGAAAGASILIALVLLKGSNGARTRRLAALFALSTACYVLVSNDALASRLGPVAHALSVPAVLGTVFFWWFAASIFDDAFRWRWWRIAPAPLVLAAFLPRFASMPESAEALRWHGHLAINILLFADVIRIATVRASDDLVDPRRRFRAVIGLVVAIVGLAIAAAEILHRNGWTPGALLQVQAAIIFLLNVGFGTWFLSSRQDLLLDEAEAVKLTASTGQREVPPADRADYERLQSIMNDGAYKEEGLTIGALASRVGLPEHQLRRLINRELGFKNFSSFLAARRIEDAKKELADPTRSRRQIVQIALELGYGSIAPFNRAFKAATGVTPTEFRRVALERRASGGRSESKTSDRF